MRLLKKLENLQEAITFAEAGDFETAKRLLRGERKEEKREEKPPHKARRIWRERLRYGR